MLLENIPLYYYKSKISSNEGKAACEKKLNIKNAMALIVF